MDDVDGMDSGLPSPAGTADNSTTEIHVRMRGAWKRSPFFLRGLGTKNTPGPCWGSGGKERAGVLCGCYICYPAIPTVMAMGRLTKCSPG